MKFTARRWPRIVRGFPRALAAALVAILISGAPAGAQNGDWFESMRRGGPVPDFLKSVLWAADTGAAENGTEASAQRERQTTDDENIGPPEPVSRPPSAGPQFYQTVPHSRVKGTLPLAGWNAAGDVKLTESAQGLITLVVRDASLSRVLSLLAQTRGLNVVAANDIDAIISITLYDVPIERALTAILSVANYTWVQQDDIILVTSLSDSGHLQADVQGRQIQVFELDFASATTVAEAVEGFLSPIGTVTLTESDPTDNRRTREMVVVEDLPMVLARIEQYICQVDRPPRQVLIEAHILQVDLSDNTKHGVNFDALSQLSGASISLETTGFANPNAQQAFLATVDGTDLDSLIEILQTTTDSKTLGSPKLLVLNEQEARIQVGEQLGFRVTTTTETSTLESVEFLDVGVVLTLTPRITRDNRVLLHVRPEVSSGQINPETGLPEEETTELETDVMLNDGQGMVIGRLIKETDSITQSKIPWLGDVWKAGWFFRKDDILKDRVEIIVALVPRIRPYDCDYHAFEQGELVKAEVPLLKGPLKRTYRPWDARLPDGYRITRPLMPCEVCEPGHDCTGWPGARYHVPTKPLPEQQFCDPCAAAPDFGGIEIITDQEFSR